MLARLRSRRPSHTTVVAYLGLFVALSTGGAYAANTIGSSDVIDESLLSQDIKNNEVKTTDLAGAAVTNPILGANSVGTGKVVDNSLTGDDVREDSLTGDDVGDNMLSGADVYEDSLGVVPNASRLGGLYVDSFLRAATEWKYLDTIGERYPVEIGNPPCSGNRECTATIRCDPGDVLLSGGFNYVDNGTRLWAAFPFNANGFDQKYLMHWANNATADTVRLMILCANQ